MNATVEQINSVQHRVKVEVTAEAVNAAFDEVYRRLQKKAKLQGFRPGKAPMNMVKKMYAGTVANEVGEKLVNGHLFEVLREKDIRPVASPVLDSSDVPTIDKPYTFSAVVDVMPKVDVQGYKNLAINCEKYDVKPETIDREIQFLRRRYAKSRNLDEGTPAAKDHLVTISHKAVLDGQNVANMDVQDVSVALGHGELLAELEAVLLGMKSGDKKTAPVTLPADYGDKELAGKTMTFDIEMKDVKELVLPTVDDEFAKDVSFESAEAMKKNIHDHLASRADGMRRQKLEANILDKLIEKNEFEVPPSMVDTVIDSMIQELDWQKKDQMQHAMHNEEVRKNFRTTARRKAQNTLILWQVAQQEKIEVTDEDIKSHVAKMMPAGTDQAQIASTATKMAARLRENLIFEKAMDFLIKSATITDIPASL